MASTSDPSLHPPQIPPALAAHKEEKKREHEDKDEEKVTEEIAEKAINEVSSGMVKDPSKTEDEVFTKIRA